MLPGPLASGLGPEGWWGGLPHPRWIQPRQRGAGAPAFSAAPAGPAQISCSLLPLPGRQAGHSSEGAAAGWPIRTPGVTGPGLPHTHWLFDLPKWNW